jgi:glycosyltransferase involved in cell wall biosynthesis
MLPIDKGNQRTMRAGMLAQALRARQHEVAWWTSAFDHSSKHLRCDHTTTMPLADGTRLKLLHARPYQQNVCLGRLVNHRQLGREFRRESKQERAPELIFCCWPTIELGYACVEYGKRHNIPVVLDVRDLWPDIFVDVIPSSIRGLARALALPYFRMTQQAFRRCTAVVGISERYLNWGLEYAGRCRKQFDGVFPLGYAEPLFSKASVDSERQALQALGVDESRTVCWFLGSFAQTYDLEPIIHAARQLQRAGTSQFQFVLSGDGEKRQAWESLARGLDNVVFTGWLDGAKIAAMMQLSRVGIAAYRKGAPQGMPNKIFEYLAAGLPILSCLGGECEEFLRSADCGAQYLAGDPQSFLAGLLTLTSSVSRHAQVAANCARVFRSRYSAANVYPALVSHLECLVTGQAVS